MNKGTRAALHTLWQAALAGGGIGEIAKSVTDHSINIPGVEQGTILACASVGAAGLSLAKHAAVVWLTTYKTKSAQSKRNADALQALIADYQAQHVAQASSLTQG